MSVNDSLEANDETQPPSMEDLDSDTPEEFAKRKRLPINTNTLLMIGLLGAVGAATYLMCLRAGSQTMRVDPNVIAASGTISTFLKGGTQEQYQLAAVQRDIKAAEARLNGTGRLLIRESGTEPLVRVMAKGEDEAVVADIVDSLCAAIADATRQQASAADSPPSRSSP